MSIFISFYGVLWAYNPIIQTIFLITHNICCTFPMEFLFLRLQRGSTSAICVPHRSRAPHSATVCYLKYSSVLQATQCAGCRCSYRKDQLQCNAMQKYDPVIYSGVLYLSLVCLLRNIYQSPWFFYNVVLPKYLEFVSLCFFRQCLDVKGLALYWRMFIHTHTLDKYRLDPHARMP